MKAVMAIALIMENKAKAVLAVIDAERPPACECGRCS